MVLVMPSVLHFECLDSEKAVQAAQVDHWSPSLFWFGDQKETAVESQRKGVLYTGYGIF